MNKYFAAFPVFSILAILLTLFMATMMVVSAYIAIISGYQPIGTIAGVTTMIGAFIIVLNLLMEI